MFRFVGFRKLTVLSLLIFANSIFLFSQTDSIYRLPVGTRITLKLETELNSKVSSVDDTFLAAISQPVRIRDAVVLPIGTLVKGRVSKIERASGAGKAGKIEVIFESLTVSDEIRRIDGVMVSPVPVETSRTFNIVSIIGGAVAGIAIGSASNTSKGALLGAAVGAGIGTSAVVLRKGKDARIRKGDEFQIELRKEVLLPVLDY